MRTRLPVVEAVHRQRGRGPLCERAVHERPRVAVPDGAETERVGADAEFNRAGAGERRLAENRAELEAVDPGAVRRRAHRHNWQARIELEASGRAPAGLVAGNVNRSCLPVMRPVYESGGCRTGRASVRHQAGGD